MTKKLLAAGLLLLIVLARLYAQEIIPLKYPSTWQLGQLPAFYTKYGSNITDMLVDVVSTPAACFYVFRAGGQRPIIERVWRRDLPKGAGCQ